MLSKNFFCPFCFQENYLQIELSYCPELVEIIEDCSVCCNPIFVSYDVNNNKVQNFFVEKAY